MSEDTVLYEEGDGVAIVTLHRPERLNALSDEMLIGLLEALERSADRDDIRALILTGSGRAFCVGGDLGAGAGGGVADAPTLVGRVGKLRRYSVVSQLLHEMPKVTIAAINGACAGAGLAIACAADFRYASDKAVFSTAFVNVAMSGDFGGTWTLPRIVGWAKAAELYLLSPKLSATEAVSIGLLTDVFPAEIFDSSVQALAQRVASCAPLAVRAIKRNLQEALDLSFAEHLDREILRHVTCMASEDGLEGASAFIDKRPPVFTGR